MLGANIQGTAAEESNTGMKLFKHRWKYHTKMWQILMHISAVHGLAAYNLAALAGPTTENEPVPGSSTSGVGASTSTDLGDVSMGMADGIDTADNFSWEILPLPRPAPVASTSMMGAPPTSSSENSGKHSHYDMVFDTAPSSVTTSYMPMSETAMSGMLQASLDVPQAPSDSKKVKLQQRVEVLVVDTTNTAALMNLQGTVNHLSDVITTSFTITDESHISDERKRAMHHMQQEEGFSADDRLALTHAFMRSPVVCGTYLDITIPKLCQAFLHSVIVEAAWVIPL
ncbi:hypothetical protein BD769DRAFT_1664504 [Suillus cothurnatus]|nr:hypothetical protein BD769DRAFT_1664504 [Suillus cothurnatus]